tara:strand:- start:1997 stop:2218 length:222 start_codon:yes stop_codon:yes gene_type:complete
MKKITDRPGRYFAILIFSPLLIYCGITVRENHINISNILIFLAILLFVYEMFWICCKDNVSLDSININEKCET